MSTQTRTNVESTGWKRQIDPRTGDLYLECEGCGIEVMPDRAEHATHDGGCEADQ